MKLQSIGARNQAMCKRKKGKRKKEEVLYEQAEYIQT